MPARRLIIALPKGGSGKTATAVAFAWALQARRKRVLLVDLDPQGHSGAAVGVNLEDVNYRVGDWLLHPGATFMPTAVSPYLHVVPSTPHEANLDRRVEKESLDVGPILVRSALNRIEDLYDYVICDCPPNLAAVAYSALLSGPVLAPVEMNRLAVSTVPTLLQALSRLRSGGWSVRLLAFLPTKCRERTTEFRESLELLEEIAKPDKHRLTKARIPATTAIARSLAESKSLYCPEYGRSNGPHAYAAALREVLPLLEKEALHG